MSRSEATRRSVLGAVGLATASLALPGEVLRAQESSRRGLPPLKIADMKTILIQPGGEHLVIVKVITDEPGLYGVGCATHGERPLAVAAAIDQHVKPILIGKDCDRIEDIWQTSYVASYFRSGVTLNNALSGVDGALWDILGKRAGLPVYQLLGGKVREAVPLYAHASARTLPALEDQVRKWMAQGYRHVRVQLAVPGYATYGAGGETSEDVQSGAARGDRPSPVFEPTPYVNNTIKMFEHLRNKLGFDVELLHDVHERVPPVQAIQLAKALEPYRLFFLEDPFAPEDAAWFQHLRSQTSTPLAMGELFVNRHEWLPLVTNRWIDFIRLHISAVGGLNMARKVAACCEFFNVRTAWHGPGQRLARGPRGQPAPRPGELQLRHPGAAPLLRHAARALPRRPRDQGGLHVRERQAGPRDRHRREGRRTFPYTSPGRNRGTDRRLDGTIVRP